MMQVKGLYGKLRRMEEKKKNERNMTDELFTPTLYVNTHGNFIHQACEGLAFWHRRVESNKVREENLDDDGSGDKGKEDHQSNPLEHHLPSVLTQVPQGHHPNQQPCHKPCQMSHVAHLLKKLATDSQHYSGWYF